MPHLLVTNDWEPSGKAAVHNAFDTILEIGYGESVCVEGQDVVVDRRNSRNGSVSRGAVWLWAQWASSCGVALGDKSRRGVGPCSGVLCEGAGCVGEDGGVGIDWSFVTCSFERSIARGGPAAEGSNGANQQRERAEFEHGRAASVPDAKPSVQFATVAASAIGSEQPRAAAAAGFAGADAFRVHAARRIQSFERFHQERGTEHCGEACEQCVFWMRGAVESERRFEGKISGEGRSRVLFLVVA